MSDSPVKEFMNRRFPTRQILQFPGMLQSEFQDLGGDFITVKFDRRGRVTDYFKGRDGVSRRSQTDIPDHEGIIVTPYPYSIGEFLLVHMELEGLGPRVGTDMHGLSMLL
jgi:hypothetical protein